MFIPSPSKIPVREWVSISDNWASWGDTRNIQRYGRGGVRSLLAFRDAAEHGKTYRTASPHPNKELFPNFSAPNFSSAEVGRLF